MGVGTNDKERLRSLCGLNPFLVRVGVGTHDTEARTLTEAVLIPSWLGWVLELNTERGTEVWARVLIPSWLGWVLEHKSQKLKCGTSSS